MYKKEYYFIIGMYDVNTIGYRILGPLKLRRQTIIQCLFNIIGFTMFTSCLSMTFNHFLL